MYFWIEMVDGPKHDREKNDAVGTCHAFNGM
jgi:hypothetical protein